MLRIVFQLPSDEGDTEVMWATPLETAFVFRLENIPLHVFGLSFGDVFRARDDRGVLTFDHVIRRGGHSTYRIALVGQSWTTRSRELLTRLEHLGAVFERSAMKMIAIDVPPESDVYDIYAVLSDGLADGTWYFDEMHVGHALRPSADRPERP